MFWTRKRTRATARSVSRRSTATRAARSGRREPALQQGKRPRRAGVLEVSTRAGYRSYLDKHFLPFVGDIPMAQILPSTVHPWISRAVRSGLSPRSVVNHHVMLHGIFKRAVRDRVIADNLCTNSELPKLITKKQRILAPAEFARLLTCIPARFTALVRRGDEHAGAGVGEHVPDLVGREHGADRVDYGTGLGDGVVAHHPLPGVRSVQRDPVARGDPDGDEAVRHPVGQGVELGEAEAVFTDDQGGAIGEPPRGLRQDVAELDHHGRRGSAEGSRWPWTALAMSTASGPTAT